MYTRRSFNTNMTPPMWQRAITDLGVTWPVTLDNDCAHLARLQQSLLASNSI